MQGYERESAAAALEEVQRLTEVTEDLERRIRNLEAIATQVEVDPRSQNVSLGAEPVTERGRLRSGS